METVEKKTAPALALALPLAFGLALAAAVIVAYLPALGAGFVWNDITYVTENRTLDGTDGLSRIWTDTRANEQYYPLVFTTYWLEKRLWGLHPLGYHLVNVLLHAGGALLLWRFLLRLRLRGAWLAAVLFALHPVCVESVAWVTERKNTLSLVLSLAAAHAWLSWREARDAARAREAEPAKRKRRGAEEEVPLLSRPAVLYGLALAAFTLALFAKTTASVVPAVLLVVLWWREGRLSWRDVRPLLPFFAVGVALSLHTAWLEKTMVRASGEEWALSLAGRLVLAGRATAFYAGKLLWPADLSFIYTRWTVDPRAALQWLPAAGALALLAAAFVLARRGARGPLASLLLFGGVLFPAMGFFNVYAMRYSYVADHFAYQAVAVGVSALVCGGAALAAKAGPIPSRLLGGAGVAVALLLALLSSRQARSYESMETLWRHTLERNPGCFLCHTNYGNWLLEAGRTDEAVEHLLASLAIRPDAVPTLLNLASVTEQQGRLDEAAAYLRRALAADPTDSEVRVHLATVLTKAGLLTEAVAEYEEALRHPTPVDFLAHNGLGAALMRLGRPAEAIEQFRTCVALRPDYEHGQRNLETALAMVQGAAGRGPLAPPGPVVPPR